jgi:hypothetical protein
MSLWQQIRNWLLPTPPSPSSKPIIDTVEHIRRTTAIILHVAEEALVRAYPQGTRQWNREMNIREMADLGRTMIQVVCTNTLYDPAQVQHGIWASFFLVAEKPLTYEVEVTDLRFLPDNPVSNVGLCTEISQVLRSVGLDCIVRPGHSPK